MEIQFYTISEDMARAANDANSMSVISRAAQQRNTASEWRVSMRLLRKSNRRDRTLLKRQREWQGDTAKSWRNTTIPTTETKRAVRQF